MRAKQFLFILLAVFVILAVVKIVKERSPAEKGSIPIRWASEEKSFVIIIPSYNNEEYVRRNLSSVLEQEYDNYRVIFIDDGSIDKTWEVAQTFSDERITWIRNETNHKTLYNLYYAIHTLRDDEIVMILDGVDWLAHTRVLKEINRYYSNPDVWMTYGQYIIYPNYEKGGEPSLQTFYAGLFKQIKMKDLVYKGQFYPSCEGLAITIPLYEMAREHAVFIPDVLYVYNRETVKEEQAFYKKEIESRTPYAKASGYQTEPKKEATVDLCIFSEDRPLQLLGFLESWEALGKGASAVHIFYTATTDEYEKGYAKVAERYKSSRWHERFLEEVTGSYVVFVKDTFVINREIDLQQAISLLEKTGAYALYFDLGLNIAHLPSKVVATTDNAFIWDFSVAQGEWAQCNRLDMTLYKKDRIQPFFKRLKFKTMQAFEHEWRKGVDLYQIGLCLNTSRAVNVPFQITRLETDEKTQLYTEKELNDRLLEGYKIDVAAMAGMNNHETAIEFYPRFIEQ